MPDCHTAQGKKGICCPTGCFSLRKAPIAVQAVSVVEAPPLPACLPPPSVGPTGATVLVTEAP